MKDERKDCGTETRTGRDGLRHTHTDRKMDKMKDREKGGEYERERRRKKERLTVENIR